MNFDGGKKAENVCPKKCILTGQDEKMLEDVCGHPINFIADSSASYSGDDDGNNNNGDDRIEYNDD